MAPGFNKSPYLVFDYQFFKILSKSGFMIKNLRK